MTADEAYARKLRLTRQLERIDEAADNAADAEQEREPGVINYRWVGARHLEVKISGEWVPVPDAVKRTTEGIKECDAVLAEAGWF